MTHSMVWIGNQLLIPIPSTHMCTFKCHKYFYMDSSVNVEHFPLKELRELSKFECKTISKPWHCRIFHAKWLCWILPSVSPSWHLFTCFVAQLSIDIFSRTYMNVLKLCRWKLIGWGMSNMPHPKDPDMGHFCLQICPPWGSLNACIKS